MATRFDRRVERLEQVVGSGLVVHVCPHRGAGFECAECRELAAQHVLATRGQGQFVTIAYDARNL